jgi:hypothetical protein
MAARATAMAEKRMLMGVLIEVVFDQVGEGGVDLASEV